MMEKVQFLRTWRWFGPEDPVTLKMIEKTPATGIVTAFHHIPNGEVWPHGEILARKKLLESHGFTWEVVESVPVHEEIKYRGKNRRKFIKNYRQTVLNLGRSGIMKICYNFMPAIDWIRTDLHFPWKNNDFSMVFDYPTFAAFDVFLLKRPNAEADYDDKLLALAKDVYEKMTVAEREKLMHSIIVVTQNFIGGGVGSATDYRRAFLEKLSEYDGMSPGDLRGNLLSFLHEVLPAAEEAGVVLCLHPDDPPFPVLGLPRIAGTTTDFQWIMDNAPSPSNGITFCTGSLSSRKDNDLPATLNKLARHVHFAHLRNTTFIDDDGSFCESGHLEGRVDMKEIVRLLHDEMARRLNAGMKNHHIPMRPDHGLVLPADIDISSMPGYSFYGRRQGLEELVRLEKETNKKDDKHI